MKTSVEISKVLCLQPKTQKKIKSGFDAALMGLGVTIGGTKNAK